MTLVVRPDAPEGITTHLTSVASLAGLTGLAIADFILVGTPEPIILD